MLKPLNISSLPKILVKILSYGLNVNSEQGTNIPACANIMQIPIDLINDDFPTAFVPYNKIPSSLSNPNEMLLGTYNSFLFKCSIKQ